MWSVLHSVINSLCHDDVSQKLAILPMSPFYKHLSLMGKHACPMCKQMHTNSFFLFVFFFLLTGLITLMHSLKLFRCAKAGWLFLRSAIILSAEHRQQNYSVGTSSTPISHSLQTQSQWEIKQNLLGSYTTTHPTFCLSHLGTTNGFSSNRRLKMYAYLHQHPFSASILRILPTIKWTMNCPCFSSLIPPSLPLTTQEIQCDVHSSTITCWKIPAVEITRALCIFHPSLPSL